MSVTTQHSNWYTRFLNLSTNLRFQILLVLLNGSLLSFFIYQGIVQEGKIFDPHPALEFIIPTHDENLSERPANISTGFTINALPIFDITKNKFVIYGIVWFLYNPEQISPDIIDHFSLVKGNILKKSEADVRILNSWQIFAKYDIVAELASDIDYRYFPLDNHAIFITLTNLLLDRKIAVFNTENTAFNILDPAYVKCRSCYGNSLIKNLTAEYGYTKSQLIEYNENTFVEHPTVVYSFSYIKPGVRSTLLIIIPILLMFFIALFPLSLDPTVNGKEIIGISIGILTSILTYRFVIENLSPQVDYFCMSDYIYTFILGSVFLLFLFNMTSLRIERLTDKIKMIRLSILLFFHGAITFFVYNILNNWI